MIADLTPLQHTMETWFLTAVLFVAIWSGSRLLGINRREKLQQLRLDAFRGAVFALTAPTGSPWYRLLGSLIARSPIVGTGEQQRLLKMLLLAGIKARGSLANFIAIKVCSALVAAGLAWLFLEWHPLSLMLARVAVFGFALLSGWRVPDIILRHLIKRRQLRLEKGMPDALDLLVVCSEAGLSLNQAIDQVSQELRFSNKDVADEFAATAAEMRVVADFSRALDNLVERTGLADLRSLVATLKQSLKFGTSLAESLRMIAGEMRAARQARMEERAARLPVLLAVPMLLFILPCLMMIVGTPVIVRIIDMFRHIKIGLGAP
jgi:tight adherence protein C